MKGAIKHILHRFRRITEFAKRVLPYRIQLFIFASIYEPEILFLQGLLSKTQGVAVDVGANQGIYTYMLSRKCKFDRVYAFEPNLAIYGVLIRKTKKFQNVKIVNMGISDTAGKLTLNIPINDKGDKITTRSTFEQVEEEHEKAEISVATLDSFNLENVTFIKIDTEGHEGNVLDGAYDVISRCRPVLMVEIDEQYAMERIKKINEWGYDCYCYDRGKLSKVTLTDFCYSKCNFLFFPRDVDAARG